MRYFNKVTQTEVLSGLHDTLSADVVMLDNDNIFFLPVPSGKIIDFDDDGIPCGYVDIGELDKTQEQINAEYRAYLDSTDWYAVRKSETGEKIPNQILKERQEARDGIIE